MKISERRLHPRVLTSGLARLDIMGNSSLVELRNLSPLGVQVEISDDDMSILISARSEEGIWPQNSIRLLPDDSLEQDESEAQAPWLSCRLIFSRRLSQHRYLAGFEFCTLVEENRNHVLHLIEQFKEQTQA